MVTLVGFSADLLSGWYSAKAAQAASRVASAGGAGTPAAAQAGGKADVIPPWDARAQPAGLTDLARDVLGDGVFFRNAEFSGLKTASADDRALFTLHQGLKRLYALASEASDKSTNDVRRAFLERRFQEGMAQLETYLAGMDIEAASIVRGAARSSAESAVKIDRGTSEYVTSVVHDGAFDAEVPAFAGAAAFTIDVTRNGATTPVTIDLSGMGATPRTLDNVAEFINSRLEAAGALSRFSRVKLGEKDDSGVIPGNQFGFKITGVSTEKLAFAAPSGAPAVYLAGVSGTGSAAAGQLTRIDTGDGAPEVAFTRRLEADGVVTTNDKGNEVSEAVAMRAKATALGPGGELYVLAETDGAAGGIAIKGQTDLVLMKYDSTGRQIWSRVLGAADTAAAADIAVDANGDVIVTGKLSGALGDTAALGGSDGFLAKYSAAGAEQWLKRFGTGANDAPGALALGADGTIYVGGATSGVMGAASFGGGDGFVRAFGAAGATLWSRQLGGAESDRVTALAIADDGGLLVGTMRGGEAVLEKYAVADGVSAAVWTHALGGMDGGVLSSIAVDGANIYVAGGAGAASDMAGEQPGHQGARDVFLRRLEDSGASAAVSWTRFLGDDSDDVATDMTVSGGAVYLTGRTGGTLPGGGELVGARNSFAAKLDAGTGALDWTTQVSGRGGLSEAFSIAVDPQGDSVLDAFGLPRGMLDYGGGQKLTERTAMRAGDHFFVSVDGGRKRKITIEEKDTYLSLSFKINAALVLDGKAQVGRSSAGDFLRIRPAKGVTIEMFAGANGRDALAALGLNPGAVRATPTDKDARGSASAAPPLYALDLPTMLSIAAKGGADAALQALDAAMTTIRDAHRQMNIDPAVQALLNRKTASGPPPAYLTAQIANLQAGLARLSAGTDMTGFLV